MSEEKIWDVGTVRNILRDEKAFVDCIYVYSKKSIHIEWRFDDKGEIHEQ